MDNKLKSVRDYGYNDLDRVITGGDMSDNVAVDIKLVEFDKPNANSIIYNKDSFLSLNSNKKEIHVFDVQGNICGTIVSTEVKDDALYAKVVLLPSKSAILNHGIDSLCPCVSIGTTNDYK
jgi:hypothetical protein